MRIEYHTKHSHLHSRISIQPIEFSWMKLKPLNKTLLHCVNTPNSNSQNTITNVLPLSNQLTKVTSDIHTILKLDEWEVRLYTIISSPLPLKSKTYNSQLTITAAKSYPLSHLITLIFGAYWLFDRQRKQKEYYGHVLKRKGPHTFQVV